VHWLKRMNFKNKYLEHHILKGKVEGIQHPQLYNKTKNKNTALSVQI